MKNYKSLIQEVASSTIVLGFGRLNPITNGHELLLDKLRQTAAANKAEHAMYITKTQDKKKNPLPVDRKLFWAKKAFPEVNFIGCNDKIRTVIEAAKEYSGKSKNLILVAGSDRVSEFDSLLNKYNGKEYNFDSIKVVSAGERDPDADDATGMSASKMRAAATSNDFVTFKKGVPDSIKEQDARKLMQELRTHMGIKSVAEMAIQVTPARNAYYLGQTFLVGQVVREGTEYFEILDRGSNYVTVADAHGHLKRKFIDSLVVEDIQMPYASPEDADTKMTFKGFHPSDSFMKNHDVVSAFEATISRYEEGKFGDSIAILRAMQNVDEMIQHIEKIVDLGEHPGGHSQVNAKVMEHFAKIRDSLTGIGEFDHHRDYLNSLLSLVQLAEIEPEPMAESMETPIVKPSDKLKVAKIIADALGVDSSGSNAETLVNSALRSMRKKNLKQDSIAIVSNMLDLADEVGIKYEKNLVPVGLQEAAPMNNPNDYENEKKVLGYNQLKRSLDKHLTLGAPETPEETPQDASDTNKVGSTFGSSSETHRKQKVRKLMGHD
jgi:nicotinic acid mononucleotide adenylyltransferase